jgi:hypothetical protein
MDVITSELKQSNRPSDLGELEITIHRSVHSTVTFENSTNPSVSIDSCSCPHSMPQPVVVTTPFQSTTFSARSIGSRPPWHRGHRRTAQNALRTARIARPVSAFERREYDTGAHKREHE